MDVIFLLGRLMLAFLVIGSAVGHLTQSDAMGGYAQSRGLPNGKLMAQVSGVLLAAGGISVLLGLWGDIGSLGLAALFLVIAVLMHAFWKDTDAQTKQTEMVSFNKNVALAGGALAFFILFASNFDGFTLTDALLDWDWLY